MLNRDYEAYARQSSNPVNERSYNEIADSWKRWTVIEEDGLFLVFGFDVLEDPESFKHRRDADICCEVNNDLEPQTMDTTVTTSTLHQPLGVFTTSDRQWRESINTDWTHEGSWRCSNSDALTSVVEHFDADAYVGGHPDFGAARHRCLEVYIRDNRVDLNNVRLDALRLAIKATGLRVHKLGWSTPYPSLLVIDRV